MAVTNVIMNSSSACSSASYAHSNASSSSSRCARCTRCSSSSVSSGRRVNVQVQRLNLRNPVDRRTRFHGLQKGVVRSGNFKESEPKLMWEALREAVDEVCSAF